MADKNQDFNGVTPDVVVVGAGSSGLAAAQYLLTETELDVVIVEASHRVGGRVRTEPYGELLGGYCYSLNLSITLSFEN